jgi:hypothetical protein
VIGRDPLVPDKGAVSGPWGHVCARDRGPWQNGLELDLTSGSEVSAVELNSSLFGRPRSFSVIHSIASVQSLSLSFPALTYITTCNPHKPVPLIRFRSHSSFARVQCTI